MRIIPGGFTDVHGNYAFRSLAIKGTTTQQHKLQGVRKLPPRYVFLHMSHRYEIAFSKLYTSFFKRIINFRVIKLND